MEQSNEKANMSKNEQRMNTLKNVHTNQIATEL